MCYAAGGEFLAGFAQQLDVFGGVFCGTELFQLLSKNHIDHGQQQQAVATGFNKVVLIGNLGGFCVAGIKHNKLAAAFLHGLYPVFKVGGGHHAAVRRHGVGTKTQKVTAVVNIRNGEIRKMAEHFQTGQHMGQLIAGGS